MMIMVLQGISMMCERRNPTLMRETLKSFVAHYQDEIFDGWAKDDGAIDSSQSRIPRRGRGAYRQRADPDRTLSVQLGAVHELRTPLNVILGFAQMLEYDSSLNADQRGNVDEILNAGQHLLKLINELLDLSKIESGCIDLSLESVDLVDLVEECRQLILPLTTARPHRRTAGVAPAGGATPWSRSGIP